MRRRGLPVIGTLIAVTWLAGLAAFPLLESTEGRYASISWGMAHGESLVEPTFNGTLLFSKPPLAYWAGALALAVLPDTEWAVRLPATLMLAACFLLTRKLGRLTGLSPERATWAGIFAALSPLAFIQGHMTTGDVFLWTGVLLALWGILDVGMRSLLRAATVGLGLSIGFMAKGHMVVFWLALPALVGWPFLRGTIRHFRWLVRPSSLIVFLVLTAPWFLNVLHRHPDLAGYWLGSETADRLLTTTHGRQGPWWYFLPQVPLLVLPWLGEWWRGLSRMIRGTSVQRLWLVFVVVPLLVFSFSGSKRPNYLLPMVTPMALIAAFGMPEVAPSTLRRRTGVWLTLLLATPFVYGLGGFAPPTRQLVREAQKAGPPLAAYRTQPSALMFYAGGRVPVLGLEDGDTVRDMAATGCDFLVPQKHLDELSRTLGHEPSTIDARADLVLVKPSVKPSLSGSADSESR